MADGARSMAARLRRPADDGLQAADAAIGDLKNVMKGLATVSDLVSKEIRELEMLCAEVDRAGHIEPH